VGRQKQRVREVAQLIKEGRGVLEGQDVIILRLDIALENDLAALFHLLEEAGRAGWAGGRPQVIIRTLDAVFDLGPEGVPPSGFVVYEGEKNVWV
jgi:hypothetical protein